MKYKVACYRRYSDYKTRDDFEFFTNRKKALSYAKILTKQVQLDEIADNKDMIAATVRVDSVYDNATRLKCGYFGDNYYLFKFKK